MGQIVLPETLGSMYTTVNIMAADNPVDTGHQ